MALSWVGMWLALSVSMWLGSYISSTARHQRPAGPNAVDLVLGYVLTAGVCLVALLARVDPLLLFVPYALAAAALACRVHLVCRTAPWRLRRLLEPGLLIRVTCILLVAAVYGPALVGASVHFQLPDVFDLPKQVAATVSAAHARRWPGPNPFFPDFPFAYNLFFYLPVGVAARLGGTATAAVPAFAAAVIWTAWVSTGVMDLAFRTLRVGGRGRLVGLLLTTLVGVGFGPLITSQGVPIGYSVARAFGASVSVDDAFVSFVYVPQHVFAVTAMVAAWLAVARGTPTLRSWTTSALLITGSALSSYILAPAALAGWCAAAITWAARDRGRVEWRGPLVSVALAIALAAPFLFEASTWADPAEHPVLGLRLTLADWTALLVGAGWMVPLAAAGVWHVARHRSRVALSYVSMLTPAACVLVAVHYPDSALKAALALRLLATPLAALGSVAIVGALPERFWVRGRWLVAAGVIVHGLLAIVTIGYFVSSAYASRPADQAAGLRALQRLPNHRAVLFLAEEQWDLAVAGHLAYMDASVYRDDAYLPFAFRTKAKQALERYRNGSCLPPAVAAAWDPSRALMTEVDRAGLGAAVAWHGADHLQWAAWSPVPDPPGVIFDPAGRAVRSDALRDVGVIAAIAMPPAQYRISIGITGFVEGAGHLSMLGVQKIIEIPAGHYDRVTTFTGDVRVAPPGFDGHLAFGLGGWAVGRGSLRLESLQVQSLVPCDGGVR